MLRGEGNVLPPEHFKPRFRFDQLEANKDYYCGYEFNPNTPIVMRAFLTNLWECFLDVSHGNFHAALAPQQITDCPLHIGNWHHMAKGRFHSGHTSLVASV